MQIVRRISGPFGSADLENSMRTLIVAEHISLDGVMQSPGGPEEDPSGEFRLGGWIVPYADEAIGQDCRTCSRSRSRCCWGVAPMTYRGVLAARPGRFRQPRHR